MVLCFKKTKQRLIVTDNKMKKQQLQPYYTTKVEDNDVAGLHIRNKSKRKCTYMCESVCASVGCGFAGKTEWNV
jgi:hypothetical protein